jgi:hypothetical protein
VHDYSTDQVGRSKYIYLAIATASILLAYGLAGLWKLLNSTPPWWLDTPAVVGFYGILWTIYTRYAWRWTYRSTTISGIPDLHGTWNGYIISSYDDRHQIPACLQIHQTATSILIELETKGSKSFSTMAAIRQSKGQFRGLHYGHLNEPKALSASTMHPHRGYVFLAFDDERSSLEGEYNTDKRRANAGIMHFERAT